MGKLAPAFWNGAVVAVSCVALTGTVSWLGSVTTASGQEVEEEPAPPADQEYTGAKECASCHFKQFLSWKNTKHSQTFDLLPEKYQKDAKCLKCHTVGYGEPTGYKDSSDAALKGTGCETCHGPGSKHGEIAKTFGKEKLSAEQEKTVRDAIWKIVPGNICVECHLTKAHKEAATPPELRTKK